jgi:hypothetical protein
MIQIDIVSKHYLQLVSMLIRNTLVHHLHTQNKKIVKHTYMRRWRCINNQVNEILYQWRLGGRSMSITLTMCLFNYNGYIN